MDWKKSQAIGVFLWQSLSEGVDLSGVLWDQFGTGFQKFLKKNRWFVRYCLLK